MLPMQDVLSNDMRPCACCYHGVAKHVESNAKSDVFLNGPPSREDNCILGHLQVRIHASVACVSHLTSRKTMNT
jgi:hypothetical protein